MANGCGIFGIYSKVVKIITGKLPSFHCGCDYHDDQYAIIANEKEREEADYVLRAEIEAKDKPITARNIFWCVRKFGKVAVTKRNFIRRIKR